MKNCILLIFLMAVPLESVTVNPALCSTNKIAPHRRIHSWNRHQPSARTFAAYYDLLLAPNTPQNNLSSLQERPEADQPDDCGEIEDYDENDLSSVSQPNRRRGEREENRLFFSGLFFRPPQNFPSYQPPTVASANPTTPTHPITRPQRPFSHNHPPPFWSGGFFGNNQYRPPASQDPSDNLKPVHEAADISEVPQTYRPQVVGGPLGHVVGVTQVVPTTPTLDETRRRRLEYYNRLQHATQTSPNPIRRPRPRMLNNDGIIGSFVNLFFK